MMNKEASRQTMFKHIKTPSLRDLMLGKKTIKSLPDNFFERVLELEIKLKKGFSMENLQELVNYYSCAIEYFESIEDPRFRDYQISLNLLLSQPEILKKMSTLNKTGKINPSNINLSSNISANNYSSKYKKQELMRKQMKVKVASSSENRETQVKNLISEAQTQKNAQNIDTLMNKDIHNQEANFKKRLEEKRKKTLLSTSDLTEQIESIKNKRVNLEGNTNTNKSFIIEGKNDGLILPPDIEGPEHGNVSFDSLNNSLVKMMHGDVEGDFETPGGDLSGIGHSSGGHSHRERGDNNQSKHHHSAYHPMHRTSKQKQILTDLKSNMDTFLTDFNFYFYDEVFQNVVEEIQLILEEKHKKTMEISTNYNNQIKEYEFLMSSDNDSSYQESFTAIIDQLKEELHTELEKLNDKYDQIIKESKKKYRNMALTTNNGIQLIEEKFRLDMFNSISHILYGHKNNK